MKIRPHRPYRRFALALCLCLVVALPSGCADPGSPSPNPTEKIPTYAGTWTQNGTSGTFDATKSLVIGSDLSYAQTVQQYESTAKLNLESTKSVTATVTAIEVDEDNAAYDTIFIDIHEVQVSPRTATEAAEWNDMAYGGLTTWVQDMDQTFSESNPGPWEHGTVWLHHVAVSVKREGDLLNVNERGGFDGLDPPEDVYFLDN